MLLLVHVCRTNCSVYSETSIKQFFLSRTTSKRHSNRAMRELGWSVFGTHTTPHFSLLQLTNKHSKVPVVISHTLLYVVVLPCYHVVMNPGIECRGLEQGSLCFKPE